MTMKRIVLVMLLTALAMPHDAAAQAPDAVWKNFAEKVDPGTELKVRLRSGQRFTAILLGVRDEGLLLQPKVRVPVPVQTVAYGDIVTLQRPRTGGMGAAKAAAIGVGSGVAAFFVIFAVLVAAYD